MLSTKMGTAASGLFLYIVATLESPWDLQNAKVSQQKKSLNQINNWCDHLLPSKQTTNPSVSSCNPRQTP